MINRSAIAVRPKQPFLDWLKSVEELEMPDVTLARLGKTLYLVPDYEDPKDAEEVLELVCEELFCRELLGWYADEEAWPQDRSLKFFKQWFDYEHFDLVEDMVASPVEDDQYFPGSEDDDCDDDCGCDQEGENAR